MLGTRRAAHIWHPWRHLRRHHPHLHATTHQPLPPGLRAAWTLDGIWLRPHSRDNPPRAGTRPRAPRPGMTAATAGARRTTPTLPKTTDVLEIDLGGEDVQTADMCAWKWAKASGYN